MCFHIIGSNSQKKRKKEAALTASLSENHQKTNKKL